MIRWEWDAAKAAANVRKHGVAFEVAMTAYDDPFALVEPDPHEDGDRLRVIGLPAGGPVVVLFVVLTEPALFKRGLGRAHHPGPEGECS